MYDLNRLRLMIDQSRAAFPDMSSDNFKVNAAVQVLLFFLGKEWCDRVVQDQQRVRNMDCWFLNDGNPKHFSIRASRIVLLADTLFKLRNMDGFGLLISRFRIRVTEPKSCFLEAFAASDFINDSATVQIRKEVNVRGHDFDFRVEYQGRFVNVEVTSKDTGNITEQSFLNTLRQKHRQLPADDPSILYVYISQAQLENLETQRHIEGAVSEFFRRHMRVNCVTVFTDLIIETVGGPFVSAMTSKDFVAPNPRFEIRKCIMNRKPYAEITTRKLINLKGSASIAPVVSALSEAGAIKKRAGGDFLFWYNEGCSDVSIL